MFPPVHALAAICALVLPLPALARDITFPALSGFSNQQVPVQPGSEFDAAGSVGSDDITGAKFAGLTTFANLPYVHCLAAEGAEVERFDIAFLGAPFDTVSDCCPHGWIEVKHLISLLTPAWQGVTARPGARYGPGGIRSGSKRMEPETWNIYTGEWPSHSPYSYRKEGWSCRKRESG